MYFFLSDLGIITTTSTKSNWFLIKYVLPFSINVPFLKGFLKQYDNGCKKITKQVICQLLSTFKLSKHYHLQFFCIQKICDISEYYHIVLTLVVIWETTIKNVKDHKEVAVELHYITLQGFFFYLGVWGRGKPGKWNSSSKFTGKERGELKKALQSKDITG